MKKIIGLSICLLSCLSLATVSFADKQSKTPYTVIGQVTAPAETSDSIVMRGQEFITRDGIMLGNEGSRNLLVKDASLAGGRNTIVVQTGKDYAGSGIPTVEADTAVLYTELAPLSGNENLSQAEAYNRHIYGSVILTKSSSADISLVNCNMIPDEKGHGYIIHTVVSNDLENMTGVADGEEAEPVNVKLENMKVVGDISHEDYQRHLNVTLKDTELIGAVNDYDVNSWINNAYDEGFRDYCPDGYYSVFHGVSVELEGNSVWNVAGESRISKLKVSAGSKINGIIYLNNEEVSVKGQILEGDIVVVPLPEEEQNWSTDIVLVRQDAEIETTEPEVIPVQPYYPLQPEYQVPETESTEAESTEEESTEEESTEPESTEEESTEPESTEEESTEPESTEEESTEPESTEEETETQTSSEKDEHEHNWELSEYSSPGCTTYGYYVYVCTDCGEEMIEELAPQGHFWGETDRQPGYVTYECLDCHEVYTEWLSEHEHDWVSYGYYPATCEEAGYYLNVCSICGEEMSAYFDSSGYWIEAALGHNFDGVTPDYWNGRESLGHVLYCTNCGTQFAETFSPHDGNEMCYCGWGMPVG